ncbi:putative protein BRICK1-B [Bulinus truncatus]|nr:putative protein BRICK1-B [Bulinus truncatus]
MAHQQPVHQRPLQQDWANREYVEVITGSIKKITDFLNSFDTSCRSRLALLNQKLTQLERRVEYIEARIAQNETLSANHLDEIEIGYQRRDSFLSWKTNSERRENLEVSRTRRNFVIPPANHSKLLNNFSNVSIYV